MTKFGEIARDPAAENGFTHFEKALCLCKCDVAVEYSGKELSHYVVNEKSDIIVLYSSSGCEFDSRVVSMLTNKLSKPLILYLTEYDEVTELVGLRMGAHDVVHAGMSANVVAERLMAAHRRGILNPERTVDLLKDGQTHSYYVDVGKNEFWIGDQKIALTTTEIKLLEVLVGRRGCIVTRVELIAVLENLLGKSVRARSVDSHIKRIRKKVAETNWKHQLIKTVYGSGYRFQPLT